jgi:glucose-1-phosphate thymidylyltransferase
VHPYIHPGWWIDTGKKDDLLEANRLLLDDVQSTTRGYVDRTSHLIGKVVIEPGAEIINSTIRGPAIIGEHTRILNSYIGPFTSIYHHCLIENSEVEHSIVLENSSIVDLPHRLEDSLIGRNVEVARSALKPRAYRLMLGDNSHVGVL